MMVIIENDINISQYSYRNYDNYHDQKFDDGHYRKYIAERSLYFWPFSHMEILEVSPSHGWFILEDFLKNQWFLG